MLSHVKAFKASIVIDSFVEYIRVRYMCVDYSRENEISQILRFERRNMLQCRQKYRNGSHILSLSLYLPS